MRSRARTVLRWVAWVLAVLVPMLVLLVLYASRPHWFPRLEDRPVFDARKAAALTAEQRAAYEHELFSELAWWNTGSRGYSDVAGIRAREARWREMAAQGFELAAITLNVLDPSSGTVFSPRGPMHRLEELAEQGDTGAMCLMVGLINRAALEIDWRPYQPIYKKWLEEGARRGHPECMQQLGRRLLMGSDGHAKDIDAGLHYLFAAGRAGYAHGAGALAVYFKDAVGLDDMTNVRRIYCWETVQDTIWTGSMDREYDGTNQLLLKLRQLHPPGTNRDWDTFIRELGTTAYTVNDCIKLGTGR